MNLLRRNTALLLLVLLCVSAISATDTFIRNKRAILPNQPSNENPSPQKSSNTNFTSNNVEAGPEKLPGNTDTDGTKPKKKEHLKIAETDECADDVHMFCPDKVNSNNIIVLSCLQDDEKIINKLSSSCHHYLWTYKLKLTKDYRFQEASSKECAAELEAIAGCKSLEPVKIIPCLIEHYEDIKSPECSLFLNKMASIIFSDYRLMDFFIQDCKKDILKLNCGRIDGPDNEDDSPHSQGKTVACLNSHRKDVSKSCKKSLLRVAELQSDDFHLDRPLYYACKGDRDHLCPDVVAGNGAIFKCLYNHLADATLSANCRTRLEERQQLIAEDVKIDKSFYVNCKEDIKRNDCTLKGNRNDAEENFSKASILLCLEEAQSNQMHVQPECLREMFELRSQLMQDYKISPELVDACEAEIEKFCPIQEKSDVLQCLMKTIAQSRSNRDRGVVSSECRAEVIKLVEVVNPGEDIRLDAPLMRACGDVVTQACADIDAGEGNTITCLLENLDHEDMTDECEDELLAIQYFAARDFRLDYHLFKQCNTDAIELCHSDGFNDPTTMKPDDGSIIFACLHRHLRSTDPNDKKPSRPCIHEMKRVMRERSFRINLMPQVEAACLTDLSTHCTDEDEHRKFGGEMECLQSILESLSEKCKDAVSNFTQEASEDIEVDRTLMRACHSMAKRFCRNLLNSDAMPLEVLDCLIEHKNHNDMNDKCAASIEHHQIVSLKDFKFNVKFHEACAQSVTLHCRGRKTKYEVVACLSELVRDDIIKETPHRVEDRCRKQLRFAHLQRAETLYLDPELEVSCRNDIHSFCNNQKNGEGEIVECLRAQKRKLSDACFKVLFQREKDEALFGDYSLHHVCKASIQKFCDPNADEADILKCLIANKNAQNYGDKCLQLVQSRQVEQAQDIELNPILQKACRMDIEKFCADVYKDKLSHGKDMEGKVIDCLTKAYATKNKVLTEECRREVQLIVKEAAVDINLNPYLMKICKSDIKQYCMDNIANTKEEDISGLNGYHVFGKGAIMECLKKHFTKLKVVKCKEEVAYAIAKSRIDVNVDPILHTTCQQDLVTHCREIPQGQGRQMSCLMSHLQNNPKSLTTKCKEMLQSRKNLWEAAAKVAPAESFSEIFDLMSSSPARNYFFAIMFTVVGVIFIVGLTCGRFTKRVRTQRKNK